MAPVTWRVKDSVDKRQHVFWPECLVKVAGSVGNKCQPGPRHDATRPLRGDSRLSFHSKLQLALALHVGDWIPVQRKGKTSPRRLCSLHLSWKARHEKVIHA